MIEDTMQEKKQQILAYEESLARRLARLVIDKPVPPAWMILIPVFFVFYAWKIREYSSGLKDFAKHYLLARQRALDTACEAEESGGQPDLEALLEEATTVPAIARPFYRTWISLLIDHYRNLLAARGKNVPELIRNHYRNKTTYLLFENQLNTAEKAYNKALLPEVEGDQQDIRYVLEKMERGIADLHRQEVEEIFP